MTSNKMTIAVEIAVLLGILVAVEWLAHVLTNTQNMFVPAVLTLGSMLFCAWRFPRRGHEAPARPPLQTDPLSSDDAAHERIL